ncbi:hypothetical protein C8J56DRAFT_262325 [Mycena floridula]|nr:hypothetical protein C8J56DRAFT_262325 [Mycena floridula]
MFCYKALALFAGVSATMASLTHSLPSLPGIVVDKRGCGSDLGEEENAGHSAEVFAGLQRGQATFSAASTCQELEVAHPSCPRSGCFWLRRQSCYDFYKDELGEDIIDVQEIIDDLREDFLGKDHFLPPRKLRPLSVAKVTSNSAAKASTSAPARAASPTSSTNSISSSSANTMSTFFDEHIEPFSESRVEPLPPLGLILAE